MWGAARWSTAVSVHSGSAVVRDPEHTDFKLSWRTDHIEAKQEDGEDEEEGEKWEGWGDWGHGGQRAEELEHNSQDGESRQSDPADGLENSNCGDREIGVGESASSAVVCVQPIRRQDSPGGAGLARKCSCRRSRRGHREGEGRPPTPEEWGQIRRACTNRQRRRTCKTQELERGERTGAGRRWSVGEKKKGSERERRRKEGKRAWRDKRRRKKGVNFVSYPFLTKLVTNNWTRTMKSTNWINRLSWDQNHTGTFERMSDISLQR